MLPARGVEKNKTVLAVFEALVGSVTSGLLCRPVDPVVAPAQNRLGSHRSSSRVLAKTLNSPRSPEHPETKRDIFLTSITQSGGFGLVGAIKVGVKLDSGRTKFDKEDSRSFLRFLVRMSSTRKLPVK